jgi:hypothetical protein
MYLMQCYSGPGPGPVTPESGQVRVRVIKRRKTFNLRNVDIVCHSLTYPTRRKRKNMSVASTSTVHRDRGGHHIVGGRPSPQQPTTTTTKSTSVSYAQQQLGVSLSEGLKKAYDGCKAKVERIALQCRAKNRKFRYVPPAPLRIQYLFTFQRVEI